MKNYLKNFSFMSVVLMCFLILVGFSSVKSAETNVHKKKKEIKIFEVHSYNIDNPCTFTQKSSFETVLSFYQKSNNVEFNIRVTYMDAEVRNTTLDQLNRISNSILKQIDEFNPDFVVVTDDDAFKYIGVPAGLKGRKVLFCGLNREFSDYRVDMKIPQKYIDNFAGVEERIKLNLFFKLLENSKFIPSTCYLILNSSERSETDYYLEENYRSELKDRFIVEPVFCNGLNDLRKKITQLNKNPKGIIIPVVQRLQTEDYPGHYVTKEIIITEIIKHNKQHLELGGNQHYSEYGLAICLSPSFEAMGKLQADILIKSISTNRFHNVILYPENMFWVNQKRLNDLKFNNIVVDNIKSINRIITWY